MVSISGKMFLFYPLYLFASLNRYSTLDRLNIIFSPQNSEGMPKLSSSFQMLVLRISLPYHLQPFANNLFYVLIFPLSFASYYFVIVVLSVVFSIFSFELNGSINTDIYASNFWEIQCLSLSFVFYVCFLCSPSGFLLSILFP